MVITIACIGIWFSVSVLAYTFNQSCNSEDKLKVMSVRRTLKQYKRLNDADNKSIF
ncbi:hypothetical protein RBU49_06990 [Clostridium sp. MB40-C1]|uniref:hypothetical protein n=1 Tax=Clostridium sp. MB40-C1 TaxID=3070996 RepID=UPI0027E1B134|nr:hypothetical protein [Clostridium sp. MB40-C1]WMJ81988.1 hypothetical protein RBU49_06990 [Clostridium sp. MB40-C1]